MIEERAEAIRVEGRVQGVGFRAHVRQLARRHGLRGWVANVGSGVSAHVCGPTTALDAFVRALRDEAPPGAHVERLDRQPAPALPADAGFAIRQ